MRGVKLCTVCEREVPRGEFARIHGKRTRLEQKCRPCVESLRGAQAYSPRVSQTSGEVRYTRNSSRAKRAMIAAKSRSKTRGLAFDLTYEWVEERFEKAVCEATGVPLNSPRYPRHRDEKAAVAQDMDATLDRIDSSGGYTMDNTRVVSYRFNTMKNKWSDEELAEAALATAAGQKLLLTEVLAMLEAVLARSWRRPT